MRDDECVEDANEDDNPLNDLGGPTGGGGGTSSQVSCGSSSGGSTIVKAASKADEIVDVAKTASKVDTLVDATATAKQGWKVGDDIAALTKAGNEPSWSTVRQRYWKNEAYYNPSKYPEQLDRLKKGLAPIGSDGFSMELHHPYGRDGANFYLFEPMTRTDHMVIHYGR